MSESTGTYATPEPQPRVVVEGHCPGCKVRRAVVEAKDAADNRRWKEAFNQLGLVVSAYALTPSQFSPPLATCRCLPGPVVSEPVDRRSGMEAALDAFEIALVEAAAAYLARDFHTTPKSMRRHTKASERAEKARRKVLALALGEAESGGKDGE